MKKHFIKYEIKNKKSDRWFYYVPYHYHRPIKTKNEITQNLHASIDRKDGDIWFKIRGCRSSTYLNSWNDFAISNNYTKSWKTAFKKRKQWS